MMANPVLSVSSMDDNDVANVSVASEIVAKASTSSPVAKPTSPLSLSASDVTTDSSALASPVMDISSACAISAVVTTSEISTPVASSASESSIAVLSTTKSAAIITSSTSSSTSVPSSTIAPQITAANQHAVVSTAFVSKSSDFPVSLGSVLIPKLVSTASSAMTPNASSSSSPSEALNLTLTYSSASSIVVPTITACTGGSNNNKVVNSVASNLSTSVKLSMNTSGSGKPVAGRVVQTFTTVTSPTEGTSSQPSMSHVHIPRGAAVVANMAGSRTSLAVTASAAQRTTPQQNRSIQLSQSAWNRGATNSKLSTGTTIFTSVASNTNPKLSRLPASPLVTRPAPGSLLTSATPTVHAALRSTSSTSSVVRNAVTTTAVVRTNSISRVTNVTNLITANTVEVMRSVPSGVSVSGVTSNPRFTVAAPIKPVEGTVLASVPNITRPTIVATPSAVSRTVLTQTRTSLGMSVRPHHTQGIRLTQATIGRPTTVTSLALTCVQRPAAPLTSSTTITTAKVRGIAGARFSLNSGTQLLPNSEPSTMAQNIRVPALVSTAISSPSSSSVSGSYATSTNITITPPARPLSSPAITVPGRPVLSASRPASTGPSTASTGPSVASTGLCLASTGPSAALTVTSVAPTVPSAGPSVATASPTVASVCPTVASTGPTAVSKGPPSGASLVRPAGTIARGCEAPVLTARTDVPRISRPTQQFMHISATNGQKIGMSGGVSNVSVIGGGSNAIRCTALNSATANGGTANSIAVRISPGTAPAGFHSTTAVQVGGGAASSGGVVTNRPGSRLADYHAGGGTSGKPFGVVGGGGSAAAAAAVLPPGTTITPTILAPSGSSSSNKHDPPTVLLQRPLHGSSANAPASTQHQHTDKSASCVVRGGGAVQGAGNRRQRGAGAAASNDLSAAQSAQGGAPAKPAASPRPTMLRKSSEFDGGNSTKACRNLTGALSSSSSGSASSPPSPKRPDSGGHSGASTGSLTLSADSSPGLLIEEVDTTEEARVPMIAAVAPPPLLDGISPRKKPRKQKLTGNELQNAPHSSDDDEAPTPSHKRFKRDTDHEDVPDGCHVWSSDSCQSRVPSLSSYSRYHALGSTGLAKNNGINSFRNSLTSSARGSPARISLNNRTSSDSTSTSSSAAALSHVVLPPNVIKTPRKNYSNISGSNANVENNFHGDVSSRAHNKSPPESSPEPTYRNKRKHMSLLNSYVRTHLPRINHFVRYSDVEVKKEKKSSVNHLAGQKLAMQRLEGWKVIHVGGQVSELVHVEQEVSSRLNEILQSLENKISAPYKAQSKDVDQICELIKANVQRSKIIQDQMKEAKIQMTNLFVHKNRVASILESIGGKRQPRKKDRRRD
ncbi:mucin-5AC isoform X2 [Hyalella azteca]|uniref:Mucin-5AC isoform X2 n=1 Tax=Hyalella azteca TaxID=294128 RepID=A0A8B7NEN9_HYAAZ|nr:mucin-5AC isoform X2 [Hyalella azteca]